MAGHVEILQSRQRARKAPAQHSWRWKPALEAAPPVASEARKGCRGRQVSVLQLPGQACKPPIENTDDFSQQTFFSSLVIVGMAAFEIGPVLVTAGQPNCHDRFTGRAESRIRPKDRHLNRPCRVMSSTMSGRKRGRLRVWGASG